MGFEEDLLSHDVGDYEWAIRSGEALRGLATWWYEQTHGRPPAVTDIGFVVDVRMFREYPAHGRTAREVLTNSWGPLPFDRAPSLFSLPRERRRGNFLYPFFGPAWGVKSDLAGFRTYLAGLKARGDGIVLLNAQQTDWGESAGDRTWTGPQEVPDSSVGWLTNPAGFVERCTIARREFGIEVVCGIVDQDLVRVAFDDAKMLAKAFAPAVRDHVCAFWTTWEIDEVRSDEEQHEFHAALVEAVGDRPFGPHFANGTHGGFEYWGTSPANTLWMQYGFESSDDQLATDTRRMRDVLDRYGKHLVAAEHSTFWPETHRNGDEAVSNRRAQVCLREGAEASLNGW